VEWKEERLMKISKLIQALDYVAKLEGDIDIYVLEDKYDALCEIGFRLVESEEDSISTANIVDLPYVEISYEIP
jgi:hypothetical protein